MYDYIISSSFGNDSVALIQWASERLDKRNKIAVVYNDTGWHEQEWEERIDIGEKWCKELGFDFIRLKYKNECGEGFEALVRKYSKFPNTRHKWCTQHLKIKPFIDWVREVDPEKESVVLTGVRREESVRRRTHSEYVDESPHHDGRDLWCPLVRMLEDERNELISKTPFKEALPHRSMECNPCVFANKRDKDWQHITERKIKVIIQMEEDLTKENGKPAYMFHPNRCQGAQGMAEWMEWAQKPVGKYDREQYELFCTSGYCGI